ncbi:hypothetical protein AB4305_19690 [Nocardia sp. 2YAB30]|uniref:hypothetical protein n=1 Tax=unclassified Nocardia TaxID=2637762 RepID=UPI003F97954D
MDTTTLALLPKFVLGSTGLDQAARGRLALEAGLEHWMTKCDIDRVAGGWDN